MLKSGVPALPICRTENSFVPFWALKASASYFGHETAHPHTLPNARINFLNVNDIQTPFVLVATQPSQVFGDSAETNIAVMIS